jgi:hypothetical protein
MHWKLQPQSLHPTGAVPGYDLAPFAPSPVVTPAARSVTRRGTSSWLPEGV